MENKFLEYWFSMPYILSFMTFNKNSLYRHKKRQKKRNIKPPPDMSFFWNSMSLSGKFSSFGMHIASLNLGILKKTQNGEELIWLGVRPVGATGCSLNIVFFFKNP